MLYLLVVLVIFFGLMGFGTLVDAKKAYKRCQQFTLMPTVPISSLDVGYYAVEGEVVVLRDRLRSPLTLQECVFFSFGAVDYKFTGKRGRPAKVAGDVQRVTFAVRDKTGVVQVDLENVKPICSSVVRVRDHKLPDEARQSVAVNYGASGSAVSYRETTLRLGEHVYVCGDVVQTAHEELRFSAAMRSNRKLHVSTLGKEALLGDAEFAWLGSVIAGIGFLVLSVVAATSFVFILVYKIPVP